jgi:thiol-disulfide isomerase/thioredoxin
MLLRKLSLLVFLFSVSFSAGAAGIEFFQGTWEEALVKSEAEGKLIFVDAYTTWCGPCKKMSADVFPLAEVGEVFNANFINVKLDMEKAESTSFRSVHSVRAYPTLFWINGKNDVVHMSVGGKQSATLIAAANEAIAKMDDLDALAEQWEAGDRAPNFVFTYVRALVRRNENHLRVANDYLRDQKDLTSEANLNIIQIAATDADSRIFELLMKNKAGIVALNGQDEFDATVNRAVASTKAKAIEFKDENLLKTAVKKLSMNDAAAGKSLALEGAFELAAVGNDGKAFAKAMGKYLKKGAAGDADKLQSVYTKASTSKFIGDERVLDMAVSAAVDAAKMAPEDKQFEGYYRLANFLLQQNKADLALPYAKLAMEKLPANSANYQRALEALIAKIEAAR